MLNRCLHRGEKMIPKIMPSFKHTNFIVYKNRVVAEGVNKYHGDANAHAEEEAMRKVSTKGTRSPKSGQKGYRSLQGPRSLCIQV
jgi:pyrimidine deaminase RibD-like protein